MSNNQEKVQQPRTSVGLPRWLAVKIQEEYGSLASGLKAIAKEHYNNQQDK